MQQELVARCPAGALPAPPCTPAGTAPPGTGGAPPAAHPTELTSTPPDTRVPAPAAVTDITAIIPVLAAVVAAGPPAASLVGPAGLTAVLVAEEATDEMIVVVVDAVTASVMVEVVDETAVKSAAVRDTI